MTKIVLLFRVFAVLCFGAVYLGCGGDFEQDQQTSSEHLERVTAPVQSLDPFQKLPTKFGNEEVCYCANERWGDTCRNTDWRPCSECVDCS